MKNPHPFDKARLCYLTLSEWKVLLCLTDGWKNSEIAEMLHISQRTVETYRYRIGEKLDLSGYGQLAFFAWKNRELLQDTYDKEFPPQ
jgi:DNA-binding NarL/FixJ family response regulator